jgi:hypothetical protein
MPNTGTRWFCLFAVEPTDSAVFNFQCFLAALDILASEVLPEAGNEYDQTTQKCLAALRAVGEQALRFSGKTARTGLENHPRAQHARSRSLPELPE